MALVELSLSPLPSHVRTARLVVVAAARRAGLDDERVDELRLALGEACSRAVGLHAQHAPGEPVSIAITDDPGRLTVAVSDRGPAAGPAPDDLTEGLLEDDDSADPVDPDLALAVVAGVVDDVEVTATDSGTTVTMRWPLPVKAGPAPTAVAST